MDGLDEQLRSQLSFHGVSVGRGSTRIVPVSVPVSTKVGRDMRCRVRPRCPEALLYRLLKRVPPEARLAALSRCFSQQQRLALERWILTQRSLPPNLRAEQPRFVWQARVGSAVALPRGKRHVNMKVGAAPPMLQKNWSSKFCPSSSVPVGIHKRVTAGSVSYSVTETAGPFSLFARSAGSLSEAVGRQRVLSYLQQRYLKAAAAGADTGLSLDASEQAFCQALADVLAHYGKDVVGSSAICFTASIPARYWVGRSLNTPRFAVAGPATLAAGLRAWRRLSEARALVKRGWTNRYTIFAHHDPAELKAAWKQVKAAYVDIWVAAGRGRAHIEAHLAQLEARHSHCRRRLIDRWLSKGVKHGVKSKLVSSPMSHLRASKRRALGSALSTVPQRAVELAASASEYPVVRPSDLALPLRHPSTLHVPAVDIHCQVSLSPPAAVRGGKSSHADDNLSPLVPSSHELKVASCSDTRSGLETDTAEASGASAMPIRDSASSSFSLATSGAAPLDQIEHLLHRWSRPKQGLFTERHGGRSVMCW